MVHHTGSVSLGVARTSFCVARGSDRLARRHPSRNGVPGQVGWCAHGDRFVCAVAPPSAIVSRMAPAPPIAYTKAGRFHIAYQVVGEGPFDLVYSPSWFSNLELWWEEPAIERVFRRLASFSRLILFDRRGTGLSDPVGLDSTPTLDDRVEDH